MPFFMALQLTLAPSHHNFTGQFASGSFMQLSEESICGEAAGETSALPLPSPDPFLLLESLSITFTANGKVRFVLRISQNRK